MTRYLLPLVLLLFVAACDTGDPMGDEIRRVIITEVEIEAAPLVRSNGDDWDGGILGFERPDIYFDLVNADTGGNAFSTFDDDFSDVDNDDFPLVWVFDPGIQFTIFTAPLAFQIWDADDNDDDFMGMTNSFTIQQLIDQGAPVLFTIQSADGSISVRIRLEYSR